MKDVAFDFLVLDCRLRDLSLGLSPFFRFRRQATNQLITLSSGGEIKRSTGESITKTGGPEDAMSLPNLPVLRHQRNQVHADLLRQGWHPMKPKIHEIDVYSCYRRQVASHSSSMSLPEQLTTINKWYEDEGPDKYDKLYAHEIHSRFAAAIERTIGEMKNEQNSFLTELERLSALHHAGKLNDEEFALAKARLLKQ